MFGFAKKTKDSNILNVVRFGGHKEINENTIDCVKREVEEEAVIDIKFFNNDIAYIKNNLKYEKMNKNNLILDSDLCPIFTIQKENQKLSIMYLIYCSNMPKPSMETQGILLLTVQDLEYIIFT